MDPDTFDRLVRLFYVLTTPYLSRRNLPQVLKVLTGLTGTQDPPPLWAFSPGIESTCQGSSVQTRWVADRSKVSADIYNTLVILRPCRFGGYWLYVKADYQRKGRYVWLRWVQATALYQQAVANAEANLVEFDLENPETQQRLTRDVFGNEEPLTRNVARRFIEVTLPYLTDLTGPEPPGQELQPKAA